MNMQTFERRESDVRGYSRTYPVVFDKALNARQTDEHGKEYIDFFAGAGVLNFGHNNERMQKAVVDYIQSNGVTHSLDMATVAKRAFIEKFEEGHPELTVEQILRTPAKKIFAEAKYKPK